MEEHAQKPGFGRAIPFLLLLLLMLITGGISLASVPLSGPAGVTSASVQAPGNTGGKSQNRTVDTPTNTPVASPTVCTTGNYTYTVTTGATIVPGTFDIGNHADDATTVITLPFTYSLYGQPYNTAQVISNGALFFGTPYDSFQITCIPNNLGTYAIAPYWTDQCTAACASSTCTGCGIFTSTTGIAPNRIFNIEWRTNYYDSNVALNYEVRLYEGSDHYDVIYNAISAKGTANDSMLTVGVQRDLTLYTSVGCDATGGTMPPVSSGHLYNYFLSSFGSCATATPSPSATYTPTSTATSTATSTMTSTSTPSATSTVCPLQFSDVPAGSTFYDFVRCLACRGIISGYPDGTFRPNANVTRGQLSKIVSNAAGFNDVQTTQMFDDIPVGSTFFDFVGRLASRGYIGGYQCGGPGEPCHAGNLPYFRPNANATRGQISKTDSNAAEFSDTPTGQQFEDVLPGSTFYTYTYRLVSRTIMSGYACGGANEPCIPPANLPYFRPNNNATRGQSSKIVGNTFYPNCQTPSAAKR